MEIIEVENGNFSLSDILKELDPDEIVFLGSHSSFFDVNQAKVFMDESYIEKLSAKLLKNWNDSVSNAKNELLRLLLSPPKWSYPIDILTSQLEKREDEIKKYLEIFPGWIKRVNQKMASLRNLEDCLARYLPIEKRAVKSVYKRIQGDGTVIIISGDEAGDYWFLEEKRK